MPLLAARRLPKLNVMRVLFFAGSSALNVSHAPGGGGAPYQRQHVWNRLHRHFSILQRQSYK